MTKIIRLIFGLARLTHDWQNFANLRLSHKILVLIVVKDSYR